MTRKTFGWLLLGLAILGVGGCRSSGANCGCDSGFHYGIGGESIEGQCCDG